MQISFARLGWVILLILACTFVGFVPAKHQYDIAIAEINYHHDATVNILKDWIVRLETKQSSQERTISLLSQEVDRLKAEKAQLLLENQRLSAQLDDLLTEPVGFYSWKSMSELGTWLRLNNISERQYVPDKYDCDDFAIDLALAAAKERRFIGLAGEKSRVRRHFFCWALVDNIVFKIEPQNDGIIRWLSRD